MPLFLLTSISWGRLSTVMLSGKSLSEIVILTKFLLRDSGMSSVLTALSKSVWIVHFNYEMFVYVGTPDVNDELFIPLFDQLHQIFVAHGFEQIIEVQTLLEILTFLIDFLLFVECTVDPCSQLYLRLIAHLMARTAQCDIWWSCSCRLSPGTSGEDMDIFSYVFLCNSSFRRAAADCPWCLSAQTESYFLFHLDCRWTI